MIITVSISDWPITSDSNFNVLAHSVLEQFFDKTHLKPWVQLLFQKILDQRSVKFIHDNILQDPLACKQIFVSILEQNQSQRWFIERKQRIAASEAHKFFNASKLEPQLKYFFESHSSQPPWPTVLPWKRRLLLSYWQLCIWQWPDCKSQSWVCALPDGFLEYALKWNAPVPMKTQKFLWTTSKMALFLHPSICYTSTTPNVSLLFYGMSLMQIISNKKFILEKK